MEIPIFENHRRQQIRHTTCYMCACRCGARVTLEDGKIRFVQGTPNHPVNRGVLCGKGNAAIMKQESPAKLRHPLMRKGARGSGEFVEISWDDALDILVRRLQNIRRSDPNKLAFFSGRDQMQAFSSLWATQFGTLNWASHGGLCSVNMAAAGLLTHGYSFWEFSEPDWDNTRYFMLWGVAEDHSSNPIKIGLKKLKERGVKIVAINPVRTGYQSIADEWIPITPGTDGKLALALIHTLLSERKIDDSFLIKYTNLPYLLGDDGLFARDKNNEPLVWCLQNKKETAASSQNIAPALVGEFVLADGRQTKTAMTVAMEQYLDDDNSPQRAAAVCGIPAKTIRRLARELAAAAFDNPPIIKTEWNDCFGKRHDSFVGRAVSMHAMRGVSAHSNGFQSCRAIHFLQALLGSMDAPGGHLAKPPYPKHPSAMPKPATATTPAQPLKTSPLGFPQSPQDLAVDDDGKPLRIDKAFSWDAPLAAHGMMQMVIANAARGDPYPLDTLIIFMSNLAWNSAMNVDGTIEMLTAKDKNGNYKIPFIVVGDAFHSEMVNYADLVLPDTTYLERHDAISLLDRPISESHAVCDAIRAPIMDKKDGTRPWQEVLLTLAVKLKLPLFADENGNAKYKDYCDFILRYEQSPGIGFLAGWRGENGESNLRGAPNLRQWQKYIDNHCFFRQELPPSMRYFRFANRDYLRYAKNAGWIDSEKQIVIELYSETLRRFQMAGEGIGEKLPPQEYQRRRLRDYCRPLPHFYSPLEKNDDDNYPFYAVTQRPMFMYHSWDSQNAWLRQIADTNPLFINRRVAKKMNLNDGDWVLIESPAGKTAARAKLMDGVAENTVWTWNAIGKKAGAWGLAVDARENVEGFLMNHLIGEHLPDDGDGDKISNSDPITGQAAWYDLRVAVAKMSDAQVSEFLARKKLAAKNATVAKPPPAKNGEPLRYCSHPAVNLHRPLQNVLLQK